MVDLLKGKYRIVREIARSNDIVYEALDTTLGRRIALKELNIAPSLTGQPRRERIERFNREARAAGRLSHPNIVAVYDFGEENGRHFIAMEYLEGQNLRDMLQVRGALPLKEAIDIACQVLDALAYAHANRVIHRDIKPDNIQILPGGQVKLTDFGIARLTEEPALTSNGQVFGTPSYMSPEQIEGRGIDHRADLFSLGIVLYEMLTGRKPFTGDSVVSITYAIMNADPPPMAGVPMGVEQVIRHALAKNPTQRQVSAEQMKLDLRNAEQTPPAFFTPSLMGQTGLGGYNAPPPMPPPYPMQNAGYGNMSVPGGYAPPPPANAPNNGNLPWAWNNPGNTPANAGQPILPSQAPPVAQPPGASNPYGFGAPAFYTPRAEPLFVLSPGMKALLFSLVLAIVIGGGIAFGLIGFLRSYDQYRENVSTQRISTLINQGVAAYNTRDYATAAGLFEQARAANPSGKERDTVNFNLTATYVQLARAKEADGKLDEARDFYRKALDISPDSTAAHNGLAGILDRTGDSASARRERAAAQDSSDDSGIPGALSTGKDSSGSAGTPGTDSQQFLNDRRAEARQLIADGTQLYRQGDRDGARAKWQEAIKAAPGTPERDQAQMLLEQTETDTPNFGG